MINDFILVDNMKYIKIMGQKKEEAYTVIINHRLYKSQYHILAMEAEILYNNPTRTPK